MRSQYELGRKLSNITSPYSGRDLAFAGQRLDNKRIQLAQYRHCTFINISFKEATLEASNFSDCTFINCYFRRTTLRNCTFEGTRFYDCDFPRVSVAGSRFFYARFNGCQIAFDEMENSLPSEPNIREELCRNLAQQSHALGLVNEARRYRRSETAAYEQHLKNGFASASQWYREHFVGTEKWRAFFRWVWSRTNRFLWGYCESGTRLIANFFASSLIVFPLVYWVVGGSGNTDQDQTAIETIDYILLSLSTATPAEFSHEVSIDDWLVMLVVSIQSLYSVVLIAMFAAFLFRWSSRQ